MKKFITTLSVIAFAYANADLKTQIEMDYINRYFNNVQTEEEYIKAHIIKGFNASDKDGLFLYNDSDAGYISIKELNLQKKVLYQELKRQKYRFPSQKEFQKRMKYLFGCNRNDISCNGMINIDMQTNSIIHVDTSGGIGLDDYLLRFDEDKGFIVKPHRFPEIVNYQKKYPHILKMEKKLKNLTIKTNHMGTYTTVRWKDVYQNGKIVQKNLDNFVNINKYLFNDDKSKIPQVFNDNKEFFSSLVYNSSYTKDKDLLDWYNKEFKQNIKIGDKIEEIGM